MVSFLLNRDSRKPEPERRRYANPARILQFDKTAQVNLYLEILQRGHRTDVLAH